MADAPSRDGAPLLVGWVATAMSVVMYVSYVDQIRLNLAGHQGSVIQPLAATVACCLWFAYGVFRRQRDWPIILANIPGILCGAATVATAL